MATAALSSDLLLSHLRRSFADVFSILLNSSLTLLDVPELPHFQRTAIVGLAGKMCGVVEFCCQTDTSVLIASRMLHMDVAEAAEHALDAIGEICNVVAGNFKHNVEGLGDGCSLSPPTVVEGSRFRIYSQGSRLLVVTGEFEGQLLSVLLRVKSLG